MIASARLIPDIYNVGRKIFYSVDVFWILFFKDWTL